MALHFNGSNIVSFIVLLAPIAAKTALSLGSGRGGGTPPSFLATEEPSSANTTTSNAAPTTSPTSSANNTDEDGDDEQAAFNALLIGLGMSVLVIALIGCVAFLLYRRFRNGGDSGAGWGRWGRWSLRRGPIRFLRIQNGVEIPVSARRPSHSPFHPDGTAILSMPQRRVGGGGGVVVGIPIPPSPRSDDDAIPSISVSLPPQGWGYDNEYLTSLTLPPASRPPFELGGTYILPVQMLTLPRSDIININNDCVDREAVREREDSHEPCDPHRQYSNNSTFAQGVE